MALKIRLARGGSKKRPYYRIVVADSRMPRDGRYVEHVGAYNPLLAKDDENRVKLDVDRIKHWMSVGAKPTDRVHRFLDAAGLLKREAKNNPKKGEPSKKTLERIEEKKQKLEDAKQAEEDAKQAAKEAEAAAKDAPKEEAPKEEAPAEAKAPKEDAPKEAEAAKDAEAPKEDAKAE